MSTKGACIAPGCDRPKVTRGYCNGHYLRVLKHGEVGDRAIGEKVSPGRGGRWIDRGGYVILTLPEEGGRRTSEHRAVMERHLGRPLRKGESVHHRNGVRHDNRTENLELWTRSHPSGQRVSEVLAWAREIVELYG